MKKLAEELKYVFATKIELKNEDLEHEIGNFLILNMKNYTLQKVVDDHEELISLNAIANIINNLDIQKAPGIDQINNKLIKHLKPGLKKLLHFFFICVTVLAFTLQTRKLKK